MAEEIVVLAKSQFEETLRQVAVHAASIVLEQAPKTSELMTKKELAVYLRCVNEENKPNVSKIDRLMKKDLPFVMFGDTPRFRKRDIDAWEAKRKNTERYARMLGLSDDKSNEVEPEIGDVRERPPQRHVVYFIHAKTAGAVKIGITNNVAKRLKALQTSNPFPLELVHVIENSSFEKERDLHERFAAHRLHGEWFSDEVLKLI